MKPALTVPVTGTEPSQARDRIVDGALDLIRQRGVTGTGMREIVAHAAAPRGSLQHYFPGGKSQIVAEAIARAAARAVQRVGTHVADPDVVATPGDLFDALCEDWAARLGTSEFASGCVLVATTADAISEPQLRASVASGFGAWLDAVAAGLGDLGVPSGRAEPLALLMISALEGAIVLARARRDVGPLRTVAAELRPLLDASS